MADDPRELLRGQLLREKRLLLLVSVILLAHQWLGITVSSSVESLGFHLEISNPARLWTGVWIVWGWALVRYGQLLYSFGPRQEFPQRRYQIARRVICDWIIERQVRREAKAVFRQTPRSGRIGLLVQNLGRWEPTDRSTHPARTQLRGSSIWLRFNIVRSVAYDPNQPQPSTRLEEIGERLRTRGDVVAWRHTGGGESLHDSQRRRDVTDALEVPIDIADGSWQVRLPAWVWTVALTSYGTEHYVPLAIGVAPAVGLALGLPR